MTIIIISSSIELTLWKMNAVFEKKTHLSIKRQRKAPHSRRSLRLYLRLGIAAAPDSKPLINVFSLWNMGYDLWFAFPPVQLPVEDDVKNENAVLRVFDFRKEKKKKK